MAKNNANVPDWVDTLGDSILKPKVPSFLDDNPTSWYDTRYPIVVAAKEWIAERHSKALMAQNRRKKTLVRIEIRRKADQPLGIHGYRDLEEGSEVSDWSNHLAEGDIVVFNLLKPESESNKRRIVGRPSSFSKDLTSKTSSSEHSLSTLGVKGVDGLGNHVPLTVEWVVKSSTPISKTKIKRKGHHCYITCESMDSKSTDENTLHFSSDNEARSLVQFVSDIKEAHAQLAKLSLKKAMESKSVTSSTTALDFVIEIISAADLEPYNGKAKRNVMVVVRYGGQKIHQTGVEKNTLNPIWTVKSDSVFLFTLNSEEFFNSDLIFDVYDSSRGNNKLLGQIMLSSQDLIKANGKRITKNLKHFDLGTRTQGYLAVRCKRAEVAEKDFFLAPQKQKNAIQKRQAFYSQPLYNKQNPTFQFERKRTIDGLDHYFVRPMDPTGTYTWLTRKEIDELCKRPSERWIEAGSGSLGELYVEILSCNGLPNLDFGPRNRTDAFANLVFEDAICTTEVVRDSLNPRFMPWTRRAFKFNVQQVNSLLYIGIFDHDFRGRRYDPVGRVAIPLLNFTPGTVFNLSYDIYDSAEVFKRKHRGEINIRLSMNWRNQRRLFLASLRDSEQFTVNLSSKQDYDCAEYTVMGYDDIREYNMKTLYGYVNELLEYQALTVYIREGLKTVIFWRAHYHFNFLWCIKMKLPFNSMIMFCFGIVFTEKPEYTVSLLFASIAWLMLGLLDMNYKRPSLWHRPPLFKNLVYRFLTGSCRPTTIDPLQYKEEDEEFLDRRKARQQQYMNMANDFANNVNEDLQELDDVKMKTLYRDAFIKPMRIDLFKKQLYPVQRTLADVVYRVRLLGRVFSWDLFHISFWITFTSICMSILTFFYWQILFLWFKRFVFYGLLGPWNKVFDVFYVRKVEVMSEEEYADRLENRKRIVRNRFHALNIGIQKEKENLVKSAAMKEHLFGKHLLAVPSLSRPERFPSEPKAVSSAIPDPNQLHKSFKDANYKDVVAGQRVPAEFVPSNFSTLFTRANNSNLVANELTPLSDDEEDHYGALH